MSKEEKMTKEEQQQLEDQAYFELCQIIEYAMMIEDIQFLETMVAAWKQKYKNILSNPSPAFKKRIDYLLNQFYSEAIRAILSQIKFKEEKAIKNQRKALHQLYSLIRDINDLPTLQKEIKKWEAKYPYDSFLKMYKVKIDAAKRDKNLRENAFNQDEAFRDLYYGVVNRSGTIDELKGYLKDWETKYSINNKYKIDDFIKHQSEIKRYVSDDYLKSIAKELPKEEDQNKTRIIPEREESPSFRVQQKAYLKLLAITKRPKDITNMFKWVYENSHINFDDEFKSLIISATNLDYPIKYLKRVKPPHINLNTAVLSYDEYSNIDRIKEYSIVSYFNLLAKGGTFSNEYFSNCISTIYTKTRQNVDKTVTADEIEELLNTTSTGHEIKASELEIKTSSTHDEISITKTDDTYSEPLNDNSEHSSDTLALDIDINKDNKFGEAKVEVKEEKPTTVTVEVKDTSKVNNTIVDIPENPVPSEEGIISSELVLDFDKLDTPDAIVFEIAPTTSKKEEPKDIKKEKMIVPEEKPEPTPLQYEQIITLSPLFFELINLKSEQVERQEEFNEELDEYLEHPGEQEISFWEIQRQKND